MVSYLIKIGKDPLLSDNKVMMIKSFLRLTRPYTQSRHHKFKITRVPGQEAIFMLPDHTTVSQLYQAINSQFDN